MRLVVHASVAVKWIFPDPVIEPGADRAVALLTSIKNGGIEVVQPPHWLLEVIAVVTRLNPAASMQAIGLLEALELSVCDDVGILRRAARLAGELQHHLFDTLYHAVALERGATLVTADQRYASKAGALGHIVLLDEFVLDTTDGGT